MCVRVPSNDAWLSSATRLGDQLAKPMIKILQLILSDPNSLSKAITQPNMDREC